jgi:hypothetical protein
MISLPSFPPMICHITHHSSHSHFTSSPPKRNNETDKETNSVFVDKRKNRIGWLNERGILSLLRLGFDLWIDLFLVHYFKNYKRSETKLVCSSWSCWKFWFNLIHVGPTTHVGVLFFDIVHVGVLLHHEINLSNFWIFYPNLILIFSQSDLTG